MTFSRILPPLLLVFLFTSSLIIQARAQNTSEYHLKVGAFGDTASDGNMGVQAEIRTHVYKMQASEYDGFWVGDVLVNGAFIQFGYVIDSPGNYCNYAEAPLRCFGNQQSVNGSEALWVWQYWPDATGSQYYYHLGGTGSGGSNGTWHTYRILPGSNGYWSFELDGHEIDELNFTAVASVQRIHVVAEKNGQLASLYQSGTLDSGKLGPLGPVEFRNLAFLKQDGWHAVSMLFAYMPCSNDPNCLPNSYGVSLLGANHIIAGTSAPQPHDGDMLWSNPSSSMSSSWKGTFAVGLAVLVGVVAVVALSLVKFHILPRRPQKKN